MAPIPAGLIDHVTPVPPALVRFAVNCCVWLPERLTVAGATETVTAGNRFTVAVLDHVGFETLVAVTVTICCAGMTAGAVYRPGAVIDPATGARAHAITALA